MGSGCLKPPSPPAQLNLSSLDSIYEDIRQQNYLINSNTAQNIQIYKQINDRITKNGKLKKLCDYLSSHRNCICQTVLHCNRLLSQSKCYAHKYVTIIVLDSIFNIGPKLNYSGSKKGITQISLVQYNSSKVVSVSGSYRESAVRNMGHKEQKERFIANNSTALHKRKLATQTTQYQQAKSSTAVNQLTSPIFQSNYFNIINLLIQQDGLLYKLSLQNLIKYCHLCQTPTSTSQTEHNKFCNKSYIGEVMKDISYHIQTNNQMGISLKCYRVMLERMKDQYFSSNVDYLGVLVDLWVSSSEAGVGQGYGSGRGGNQPIQSSKSISLEDNYMSLQQQTQRLVQIIQIFLSACIEQYQNNTIVEQIFKMLDKYKFRNVNKIQNILFDAIQGNQLKRQFYKKMMLYLLAYVAYPQCSYIYEYGSSVLRDQSRYFDSTRTNQNQDNMNNMHVLQKQWMECYGMGSPALLGKKYKNIKCAECKLSCLAKINKWIFVDKIVSIQELVMYSGLGLLNGFVFNLYTDDQTVKDKVVVEFKSFVGSLSADKNKGKNHHQEQEERDLMLEVGNMLMIQVEQNRIYDDHVRYTLLSIWENVIEKRKQIILQENHGHVILSLNFAYCYENNVKIISLMSIILGKISNQSVKIHLERICQFYDSLYKEIFTGFTNAQQKIRLIDQFAGCFGSESKKGNRILKGIYMAFLQKLTKIATKRQNNKEIMQECYVFFIDYLIYIVAKILALGIASPNLLEYKNKIISTRDSQQLAILQQYNAERVPLQIVISNKEESELFKESIEYFRIKQNIQYDMTGTGSVFWKGTQSVESCHSRDSTYTKGDKQLEDVLDILRI